MAIKRIVKEYIDDSVKPLKTNGRMELDELARSYIRNKLRKEYDVDSFKTNLNTVTDNILDEFLRYIEDEASGFLINELTYEDGLVKGSELRNAVREFIDFNLRENDINEYDVDYVSENLDEARQMHTWSITYNGKGNKAKTHMVDAPDAYEANRKARRELGISYNDIEDVTMLENKTVTESIENEYGETLYKFIIGSGLYRPYIFYAYGYNEQDALDKIIDQLEHDDNSNIYTFDEVENEGLYDDEYVVGGNHGVALRHYGEFRIETPDSDDTSDGQFITESKSSIKESKDNYNKYKLVDYYDVWGNEEDGFEVNDIAVIADDVVISDDADEQDILDLLYNMEYLNTKDPNKVYVNMSDFDMMELFDATNDCPIGRLERIW